MHGVCGKSVLLKNLERTILIKCSLHIERNIHAYIRTYNIYVYSPFGGYIFNLGDYKFETKFTNEKSETRKIGLPRQPTEGKVSLLVNLGTAGRCGQLSTVCQG